MAVHNEGTLFLLSAGSIRGDACEVVAWHGREALSTLYEFEVNARVDPLLAGEVVTRALGEAATLTVAGARGVVRQVHGIVSEVRLDGRDETWWFRIVPRLWTTTQRMTTRVFQDCAIDQVISAVLARGSIDHAWRLLRKLPPRAYCVQYQETDYQFIARLLAEAGVAYAFEQPLQVEESASPPVERVVFFDAVGGYRPLPPAPDEVVDERVEHPHVAFGRAAGMSTRAESLWRIDCRATLRPSSVSLKGYDSLRPSLDLSASTAACVEALAPHEDAMSHYVHEDAFEESDASRASSVTRLEQLRADARVDESEGDCARMTPGRTFAVEGHPLALFQAPRVVLAVEHEGRAAQHGDKLTQEERVERLYRNRVRSAPADVMARPPRPQRATVQTLETAVVVGPPGQEVYVDALGRVRVEFHWNREAPRDGSNTCWLRVSQAWSGAGFGAQFIPRVGTEVLVSFLGGDPDRPVVTGSLYSAEQRFPFDLEAPHASSGVRTQSVPGGGGHNELSFHDEKHRELVFLRAERDLRARAQRSYDLHAGEGHERFDRSLTTAAGGDVNLSAGGRTRVFSHAGHEHNVGGAAQVTTASDMLHKVGGAFNVKATGAVDLQSGVFHAKTSGEASVHASAVVIQSRGATLQKSQGSWNVTSAASAAVSAADAITLSVGASGIEVKGDSVRLWCGSTSITLEADKVAAVTGEASIIASDKISLKGGDATGELAGGVRLSGSSFEAAGDSVSLRSSGASLDLDGEASLVGGAVRLNSGSGGSHQGNDSSDDDGSDEPFVLRMKLRDAEGTSLANKRFVVSLDGREYPEGATDGDGIAEVEVSPGARAGALRVWSSDDDPPIEIPLRVQPIADAATIRGAKQRLANLGYYHGPIDDRDDAVLAAAVAHFQRASSIDETGELDGATRDALTSEHA